MWRFLIIVALFYLVFRLIKNLGAPKSHNFLDGQDLVQDSLTRVYFAKKDAIVVHRNQKTYFFSSKENRDKFLEEISNDFS